MTHPKVVALTGAIGSGKSRAAELFAALGVPVLDSDALARSLHQDPAHPATHALAHAFPHAMEAPGRLRRGSLRELFARDPAANAHLKRILAPHVFARARQWSEAQRAPYVIWESALILDYPDEAARIVSVDAPFEMRQARVASRNPTWSAADFAAVSSMQPTRAAFIAAADDVLDNAGDTEALRRQVQQLHLQYLSWSAQ